MNPVLSRESSVEVPSVGIPSMGIPSVRKNSEGTPSFGKPSVEKPSVGDLHTSLLLTLLTEIFFFNISIFCCKRSQVQ